jgi:hypothetical protein
VSVLDLIKHLARHAFHRYSALGWPLMVGVAVALPALAFAVGVVVVLALPSDYFVRGSALRGFWQSHGVFRWLLAALKNIVGVVVFCAGFVMALPLVPGPGLLLMLVGLGLVDFPGKRALEQRILRQPRVLSSVNRTRACFGRPPMQAAEVKVGLEAQRGPKAANPA